MFGEKIFFKKIFLENIILTKSKGFLVFNKLLFNLFKVFEAAFFTGQLPLNALICYLENFLCLIKDTVNM